MGVVGIVGTITIIARFIADFVGIARIANVIVTLGVAITLIIVGLLQFAEDTIGVMGATVTMASAIVLQLIADIANIVRIAGATVTMGVVVTVIVVALRI